jgi:hypothetical protein
MNLNAQGMKSLGLRWPLWHMQLAESLATGDSKSLPLSRQIINTAGG